MFKSKRAWVFITPPHVHTRDHKQNKQKKIKTNTQLDAKRRDLPKRLATVWQWCNSGIKNIKILEMPVLELQWQCAHYSDEKLISRRHEGKEDETTVRMVNGSVEWAHFVLHSIPGFHFLSRNNSCIKLMQELIYSAFTADKLDCKQCLSG